ncbi:MAG: ATP-dependent DNA helicase RecG [Rhodospirillales bacterium]|nr:ATP-dependent DNA helicase RecG [Rhodospirillales bacterium]
MRPAPLFPLFSGLETLAGVGAATVKTLTRLIGGGRIVDLLWHLPTGLIDRSTTPSIAEARPHAMATLTVRVVEHGPPRSRRQPWRILCEDASGEIILVFFNARGDWLTKVLPPGEVRVVSGMVEAYGEALQMVHPDYIVEPAAAAETLSGMEPVYPMTAGLAPKLLLKALHAAIERAPALDEWLDPALRQRNCWPSWRDALATVHAPASEADLAPTAPARARLAYDELLANQLALAVVRRRWRRQPGRATRAEGKMAKRVLERLTFTLTVSQDQALAEITADMAQPARMLRLLQGDVGSGKTVVALLAMLHAVEAGAQAALMAPTELLARQHLATIGKLAEAAGVRTQLLTGREKEGARRATIEGVAAGEIGIVVGTHALLQDSVTFRDLALAVIDEQHRFGVDQRLALASKGERTDVLVMSATPIPRTLTLTAYGDLDVSRLTEKPPGRRPVDTRVLPVDRLEEVTVALGRMLASGAKAYWVCPLVEESETLDLAAAQARHASLAANFPGRVGLVHGRMKTAERDAAMRAFRDGPASVLVATTVIEVGVDVPAATVMVIEHAERFGLAQLHQLRGRVGRSAAASTCILLYAPPIGEAARARLAVLRQTDDGFRIAEEDLRLRGAGDLLGVKQSGLPAFRLADLAVHADLLATAADDARLILERDPELTAERGRALRTLLYLFERDAAIRTLRAG